MVRAASSAILVILFLSCSIGGSKRSLDLDEAGIDRYVSEKLDSSQLYDILSGMRYSRGSDAYTVVRFSQNDTVVLFTEEVEQEEGITFRNTFFKEGLPVFVEENFSKPVEDHFTYTERKVYLNGAIILKAYERSSETIEDLEQTPFSEITITLNQFDFEKPERAVSQSGEFEMHFGEFMGFGGNTYLVLENKTSGYNVALLLYSGDPLLDQLYGDPLKYQGRVIQPIHEFMFIGGMEQMVYTGGTMPE